MDITIIAVRNSCITPQASINPTVGGININGNIYIKNLPVSFTADKGNTSVASAVNSITIP